MDEKCFVDGCPGTAKFSCSCSEKLLICQEHIAEHIKGLSYHEICCSKKYQTMPNQRVNQAIFTLNNLNSRALSEGKDMFKELCDKLCGVVDELSKRQQCLVDLGTSNYTQEVEQKIQELEKVNIAFRDKNDFKKLLDNFMSPGGQTFDSLNLEEFKKDFRGIVESLKISNEVLNIVAVNHNQEKALREQLKNRVEKLEQGCGKIQNFDERLQRVELAAETHLKIVENFSKDLEKADNKVETVDKRLKEKLKEIESQSKNQMIQFKAIVDGLRKSVEENKKTLNENYKKMNDKVSQILQVKDNGFRQMLEIFFDEIKDRRIVRES